MSRTVTLYQFSFVRTRQVFLTLDMIDDLCLVYKRKNLNQLSIKYQSSQNVKISRRIRTKNMTNVTVL